MKVYYTYRQCPFNEETNTYDGPGKWDVTEFSTSEIWKRMRVDDFFSFLKKCYLSKRKAQQFCDWENTPDINFGGMLQIYD